MKVREINVFYREPGAAFGLTVNVTSTDIGGAYVSLVGGVELGRAFTSPLGHQDSAAPRISFVSTRSAPFPLDTTIQVNVSFGTTPDTIMIALKAWVERDTVTRYGVRNSAGWGRPVTLYRHDLDLVDTLGVLSAIPAPDLPAQALRYRLDALRAVAGVGDLLFSVAATVPVRILNTPLAASTGGTVLSVLRAAADSVGYRVVTNQSGNAAIIPDAIATSPAPNWWQPTVLTPNSYKPIPLTDAQIREVPIALSRLSHVSTVEITRQVAGAAVTDTISDNRRYGTYQATTQLVLDSVGLTCFALDDLRAFAAAATSAPIEPAPTEPVAILDTGPVEDAGGVLWRLMDDPIAVVRIEGDGRLPAVAIGAGYALTIRPDLEADLELAIYPASLYGLIPIRSSHIGTSRHDSAYTLVSNVAAPAPVRFHHLAANRKP